MKQMIAGTSTFRRWIVAVLICILSFVGGLLASKAEEVVDIGDMWQKSDIKWAEEKGFLTKGLTEKEPITQAEFMKMLVLAFAPKENGIIVPPGAENHWAAPFYATAKKEGIIGCSCIIKPDSLITVKEAANLVIQAIAHSGSSDSVGTNEVEKWINKQNEAENQINVKESARLIRKMEETIRGKS